jgi:hypothetical protein
VSQNARGGSALSIAWVKRDRFAVMTKANFIQITDVNTNEMTKKVLLLLFLLLLMMMMLLSF